MSRPAVPVIPGTAVRVGSRLILSVLLSGATLMASVQTYREFLIEHVDRLEADPMTDAGAVDAADGEIDPASMPPRMALALALMQARVAARTTNMAVRAARLSRADRLIDRAIAVRSGWGDAWIVVAYISWVGNGPAAPDTLAAFTRSLEISPYRIAAAPWRIRYGASQWDRLTPATRERVLDEAQWFSDLAPSYARFVQDMLKKGPAARAFAARRGSA